MGFILLVAVARYLYNITVLGVYFFSIYGMFDEYFSTHFVLIT